MLPYSTNAFTISDGPKKRVLLFFGAIVVYRDGSVSRIENIEFLGLWGSNILRKAISLMNGSTRRISVTLRPRPEFRFEDVRQRTVEYLGKDPDLLEQYFDQEEDPEPVLDRVKRSSTYEELFDVLEVPEPTDCLDILV
ncbi:hypothetical protein ACQR1W_30945 [Bradyrhizobium sp. HKCCYLS1011]|uniref:hypothetical protein n=1 Tax=Bradyrhizobium sp. HKCCYLS1011 TaxID=3420733 RepID=UPI003EBDA67B